MTATKIHPTAIVDPAAKLGEGVEIGPYCVIGPEVIIGDRCKLKSHVVVEGITELGPDNQLFQFSSVGAVPQDLKFGGERSRVVIGRGNIIRESVTIHAGTEKGNMQTVVGNGNLLMACSHVAHDCTLGDNNVLANYVGLAGHVTLGSRVILGGMVGIHQFVRLGDFALISAGSMVGLDVPPYCIAQGDRCSLRGINVIGLDRAGFTAEEVGDIKKTFRALFSGHGGGFKKRLEDFPADLGARPHVKRMLDFLSSSKRGITMARRTGESEE